VKRYWGDYGCPITCMKLGVIKTGPYKGAITDCPDYELEAYEGPNLGVFNAEGVLYLSALIDELGLSGINGGNVMAFAAELYQRGILKKEDLDGLEPTWGDVDAFAELARRISTRDGEYYDILAEGTYRAALKISEIKGVDVTPFAVHVKGVEVGAHGTRSGLDLNPIAYACSVQGGDHTSSVSDAYSDMDRVFFDSAVVCSIATWRLGETVWRCIRPVTGWDITQEKWRTELAPRIIHIQQAAQLLGGPDIKWRPGEDDDNPPRFYEPLPSGPHKGETTDREEFQRRRSEYYQAIGWDESGIPKSETLQEMGLETVDRALAKLRR